MFNSDNVMKDIIFNETARKKLAEGADILARAVTSTLGPRSNNVAINQKNTYPFIVHDGVTVAKNVILKDHFADMGANLLAEASIRTNNLAGDGTTTAVLLANTLIQGGIRLIDSGITDGVISPKINPMHLREVFLKYSAVITDTLNKKAKKLKKSDIYKIAEISAGMKDIASLVSEAYDKVGSEGLIMIESAPSIKSHVEVTQGMEFDNGFLSPFFVTDPNRMITEYDDAFILLTDMTIADGMLLVPIIEKVIKAGQNKKALLIIANDVVGPALQAMVLTKQKSGVPLVAVIAPEYADRRKEMLQDIAVLTGARVFSYDMNDDLTKIELSDLGKASIKVTQTHTTIKPQYPDTDEIKERAKAIREQIKNETNTFRKERLEYRLGKLVQGIASVYIGGSSEVEVNEKRERAKDAIYAVRAAISEGVVAGAGVTLRDIASELKVIDNDEIHNLVQNALRSPFETILGNAGIRIDEEFKTGEGVDVVTKERGDLISMNILDPVKVTRLAVEHAFSVAGMLLTTSCLISDLPEESVQKIKVV